MWSRLYKLFNILHLYGFKLFVLIFSCRDQLWMSPEIKELCPAFNKIRKLSVRGIFVDFDIEWTIAFLEAAPLVEILIIGVTSDVSALHYYFSSLVTLPEMIRAL